MGKPWHKQKMKRLGNTYNKIISRENLELAFDKAKKGKTWQDKAKFAEAHRKELLDELEIVLQKRQYKTSEYLPFSLSRKCSLSLRPLSGSSLILSPSQMKLKS